MSSNICALRKACLRVFALTATCFLLLGMRPVSAQTIGACVTQEGTCEWTPDQDCLKFGGTYVGDSVTCDEGSSTSATSQSPLVEPSPEASASPGPFCCQYANVGATPVKDCKAGLTCPSPGTPVFTDIRCETRACPATVNVEFHCLNSTGGTEKGHKCERTILTPTCVSGCRRP